MLDDLPEVTQLVGGRAGLKPWLACLLSYTQYCPGGLLLEPFSEGKKTSGSENLGAAPLPFIMHLQWAGVLLHCSLSHSLDRRLRGVCTCRGWIRGWLIAHRLTVRKKWVQVSVPPLRNSEVMGKLPNLPEPRFPSLYHENNNGTNFLGLLWALTGIIYTTKVNHFCKSLNSNNRTTGN